MTNTELFKLGVRYYTGDGVEQNRQKAAECFKQAAEAGDTSSQFNLGLLYKLGDGVEADFGKSRDWFEKAAAQGHERAKQQLLGLYLMLVRSYVGFGSSAYELAKETALRALSLADELNNPSDADREIQREACRYLGMLAIVGHWKEVDSLLQGKAYYEKALPIHESKDPDVMVTYPIALDNLGDLTGDTAYYSAAYDAASDIYNNAFERITDADQKETILSFLVMEKILGRFHSVDLDTAEVLNEKIRTLGTGSNLYEHYRQAIEQKRRESRSYSSYTPSYSSSYSYSSSSSSSKVGDKVKGFLGNLFK